MLTYSISRCVYDGTVISTRLGAGPSLFYNSFPLLCYCWGGCGSAGDPFCLLSVRNYLSFIIFRRDFWFFISSEVYIYCFSSSRYLCNASAIDLPLLVLIYTPRAISVSRSSVYSLVGIILKYCAVYFRKRLLKSFYKRIFI